MQKQIFIAAAFAGLIAVVLGAFGAHSLKNVLTPYQISIWDKAVQYQFYHALALLGSSLYLHLKPSKRIVYACYSFIAGIACFSGSLYLLATVELHHMPTFVLGPITPIGGLFFVTGWAWLAIEALKQSNSKN